LFRNNDERGETDGNACGKTSGDGGPDGGGLRRCPAGVGGRRRGRPDHRPGDADLGALVPAASNGSVTCNMVRGNFSEGVRRLQDTMNDCYRTALTRVGVYPLVIDGDFGGNTERALREVQRVAGTAADGQYGPNTRRAMLHVDPDFGDPCRRVS
jgi:hypothetical protein